MRSTVYFELATRVTDGRVAELMRFPFFEKLAEGTWTGKWWSGGSTKRLSSLNREKVIEAAVADRFNELALKWKVRRPSYGDAHIEEVVLYYSHGRRSSLWAPVPTERLPNVEDDRARRSFTWSGVPSPNEDISTAQFTLTLGNPSLEDEDELQRTSIELFRSCLPPRFEELNCFGYGCVGGDCRKSDMVRGLGGVDPWIDQLGLKFENVYPILIGSSSVCQRLRNILGGTCDLFSLPCVPSTMIVSIPSQLVDSVRTNPAVAELLILRDVKQLNAAPNVIEEAFERLRKLPWLAPLVRR